LIGWRIYCFFKVGKAAFVAKQKAEKPEDRRFGLQRGVGVQL